MYQQLTPELIETFKGVSNVQPLGIISASAHFSKERMEEKGELDHYIGAATTQVAPRVWHVWKSPHQHGLCLLRLATFRVRFRMCGDESTPSGFLRPIMNLAKDRKCCGMSTRMSPCRSTEARYGFRSGRAEATFSIPKMKQENRPDAWKG